VAKPVKVGTPFRVADDPDRVTDGEFSHGAPLCGPLGVRLLAVS
jgi:hypothetical protein